MLKNFSGCSAALLLAKGYWWRIMTGSKSFASRLSTVDVDTPIDSWYKTISGQVEGPEPYLGEPQSLTYDASTEINYTSDNQNNWFYNPDGLTPEFDDGEGKNIQLMTTTKIYSSRTW